MQVFADPDIRQKFERFLVNKGIGDETRVRNLVDEFILSQTIPFGRDTFLRLARSLCLNPGTKDLLARYTPEEICGWWESFEPTLDPALDKSADALPSLLEKYIRELTTFIMNHPMIPNGLKREQSTFDQIFSEWKVAPRPGLLDDAWANQKHQDPPLWSPPTDVSSLWLDPLTASLKEEEESSDETQPPEDQPATSKGPESEVETEDASDSSKSEKKKLKFVNLVKKIRKDLEIETSLEELVSLLDTEELRRLQPKEAVKRVIKIIGKREGLTHSVLSEYFSRLSKKLFSK